MSLATFIYKAIDASGKELRGTIQASSQAEAFRKMSGAGMTPLTIEVVRERRAQFSFQQVNEADIVSLSRELAVLVEARIPLDRGLRSIAEHGGKPELVSMIRDIAATIESGHPMTKALEKYRSIFGEVYIETIRAGEKSGNLQAVMAHLAELLERSAETRQQVRRAMIYPAVVMAVVAVAVTIIVVFVVPRFASQFEAAGSQMPLMTRIVQGLGESVRAYWFLYLGALVSAFMSLTLAWRSRSGRFFLECLLTRVPYVGRILVAVTAGRFARVVAIALSSGLDMIEAIQVAGRSTGRPVFSKQCQDMGEAMRRGQSLGEALRTTNYIPSFAQRMIGAGKDSAEVAKACSIVARHYEHESSNLTKNINTIIEPILTVVMAAIVLLVALSVFLPMWQMARLNH